MQKQEFLKNEANYYMRKTVGKNHRKHNHTQCMVEQALNLNNFMIHKVLCES